MCPLQPIIKPQMEKRYAQAQAPAAPVEAPPNPEEAKSPDLATRMNTDDKQKRRLALAGLAGNTAGALSTTARATAGGGTLLGS